MAIVTLGWMACPGLAVVVGYSLLKSYILYDRIAVARVDIFFARQASDVVAKPGETVALNVAGALVDMCICVDIAYNYSTSAIPSMHILW